MGLDLDFVRITHRDLPPAGITRLIDLLDPHSYLLLIEEGVSFRKNYYARDIVREVLEVAGIEFHATTLYELSQPSVEEILSRTQTALSRIETASPNQRDYRRDDLVDFQTGLSTWHREFNYRRSLFGFTWCP